tara:strand:- start:339 stop:638 length:300 start_codon:yes stop_codon:yes gene_type:complete
MKIHFCKLDELEVGPVTKYIDKIKDELIVFKDLISGDIKAFSSICPHHGGPIKYSKKKLVCYWHNFQFDCRTAECINHNTNLKLREQKILIENGSIFII